MNHICLAYIDKSNYIYPTKKRRKIDGGILQMDRRIYLLTAIAFVVGMVELIIGGILNLIAYDLQVTIGKAGWLITIFALTFALSGPPLLYFTKHIERKKLIIISLFIFLSGNLLAYFSPTYGMLFLARILSAMSGSLLAVISLTLAPQLSNKKYRGRAIGLVIMGTSGSVVLGLPFGVSLGQAFGWRIPFLVIIFLTILLALFIQLFFGEIKQKEPIAFRKQFLTLKNKRVLASHLITFFFLAGHFTLYGYLTPFLEQHMGYMGQMITIIYFVYGASAVTGGGLGGILTDRFGAEKTLKTVILLLALSLFVIPYTQSICFWGILVIWGILSWAITPAVHSHLIYLAEDTADIQQSLNNTALHLGIAFGTLIGGIITDQLSLQWNSLFGVGLVIVSFLFFSIAFKRQPLQVSESSKI